MKRSKRDSLHGKIINGGWYLLVSVGIGLSAVTLYDKTLIDPYRANLNNESSATFESIATQADTLRKFSEQAHL